MLPISQLSMHTYVDLTTTNNTCIHVRDICVGVKTKHFGRVCVVELTNVVHVLWHLVTLGDRVALVEVERRSEHVLTEPDLAEREQQTLVKVVCHAAAILDLAEHVAHTRPYHTLER